MPALPRNVKALGLVSLLNDASSEMIFPLLPTFLTRVVGAAPLSLGVIEGAAEAAAAVMKVLAGRRSDRVVRRKPMVLLGYGLASVARPLIALTTAAGQVLTLRVIDRVGKGIRSGPRDALIAEATPKEQHGRAFGFHRAMDHAGALVGPLLASAVLLFRNDLRLVFGLAAIPAAAVLWTLATQVRETTPASAAAPNTASPPADRPAAKALPFYLLVMAVFTLGNSSDAFLLLRAQDAGVAMAAVPLLWSLHHVVKSALSTPAGSLSDRLGRKRAIVTGWGVYALSYAGFAVAARAWHFWALFAVYGLYHAFSEGPERALLADLAGSSTRGRDFGWYHAITGGMQLPASLLTGYLWQSQGAAAALGVGAGLAAVAAVLLVFVPSRR
jgi:MFS family permease